MRGFIIHRCLKGVADFLGGGLSLPGLSPECALGRGDHFCAVRVLIILFTGNQVFSASTQTPDILA